MHRLCLVFPLILFVSMSGIAFSPASRADVILPAHKEVTFNGTLKGDATGYWLESGPRKRPLHFFDNTQLEALAKNLIDKRVEVRGKPSGSGIEVHNLTEAK